MNFHLPRYLRFATVGVSLVVSAASAGAAGANPHPSIRAILGAQPIDHLEASTTALVIIDFQKEYFSGRLPIPDGRRALAQAQRLVAFADQARMPVFQVQHVAPAGSALFAADGDTVSFEPGMLRPAGRFSFGRTHRDTSWISCLPCASSAASSRPRGSRRRSGSTCRTPPSGGS